MHLEQFSNHFCSENISQLVLRAHNMKQSEKLREIKILHIFWEFLTILSMYLTSPVGREGIKYLTPREGITISSPRAEGKVTQYLGKALFAPFTK